jgi:hypothetical protein
MRLSKEHVIRASNSQPRLEEISESDWCSIDYHVLRVSFLTANKSHQARRKARVLYFLQSKWQVYQFILDSEIS